MARLKDYYKEKVVPALVREFSYENPMQVPKIVKIVVNMGLGEAISNVKMLDTAAAEIAMITGQKPVITRAKKSIATFKLRQGMPIGCSVTLRKEIMYEFFDRLVNVALPKVRDFRGISSTAFDGRGNYSLGLHKQIIFPEIDYDKVRQLEGWKEKSIQNLKEGIEASKQNELYRLIVGLSIRHVGSTTAKMLAKKVDKLTDFQYWTQEQYNELEDVGPKVAQSLYQFFTDKENIDLIESLSTLGVNIYKTEAVLASNKLEGKTFLCTGTFPKFSRDDIKLMIEKNGGKNLSAVSSNLDYLIAGEKAGGKLTKAQKIPTIQVISEEDFLKMIE